jgi:hypothetical protein
VWPARENMLPGKNAVIVAENAIPLFLRHTVLMPDDDELAEEEIAQRMRAGLRRALSTPPKPTKQLVGRTERAQSQRESREIRVRRSKPKAP